MRLFVLHMGFVEAAATEILGRGADRDETLRLPVPSYLIETDSGDRILVDSGLHETLVDDPGSAFAGDAELSRAIRPEVTKENLLPAQLALLGLMPSDISMLFNTHLHFDHCGGNHLFDSIPIFVQREAYVAALAAGRTRTYFDLPGLDYRLLDGETELVPGLELLLTPGHAAGLTSLLVRLDSGPVLICGDAIQTAAVLADRCWDAFEDPLAGQRSAERLLQIASEEDARILFGHDPDQWEEIPRAPESFE